LLRLVPLYTLCGLIRREHTYYFDFLCTICRRRERFREKLAALRRPRGFGGVVDICGDVSEEERDRAIGIWP
jgi:hypothetical protein